MLCSYLTKQAQPACSACLQMNHIFMTPHVYTERVSEVVRVCRERGFLFIYLFIYLSRGIQFSRASLNGALKAVLVTVTRKT